MTSQRPHSLVLIAARPRLHTSILSRMMAPAKGLCRGCPGVRWSWKCLAHRRADHRGTPCPADAGQDHTPEVPGTGQARHTSTNRCSCHFLHDKHLAWRRGLLPLLNPPTCSVAAARGRWGLSQTRSDFHKCQTAPVPNSWVCSPEARQCQRSRGRLELCSASTAWPLLGAFSGLKAKPIVLQYSCQTLIPGFDKGRMYGIMSG